MALAPVRTPQETPLDNSALAVLQSIDQRLAALEEARGQVDVAQRKRLLDLLDAMQRDYELRLAWWVKAATAAHQLLADLGPDEADSASAAVPDLGAIMARAVADERAPQQTASPASPSLPPELASILGNLMTPKA